MTKRAETKQKKGLKFCSIEQELLFGFEFLSLVIVYEAGWEGQILSVSNQRYVRYRHAAFLLAFHSSTMYAQPAIQHKGPI